MGFIDRKPPLERPHSCKLPGTPTYRYDNAIGPGTLYQCDGCGKIYVLKRRRLAGDGSYRRRAYKWSRTRTQAAVKQTEKFEA